MSNPTTQFTLDEDGDPFKLELLAVDQEFPSTAVVYQSSVPANGQLSGVGPNYFYTPNKDFSGTDQFTLTLLDTNQNSTDYNVTLVVNPINDLPLAVSDTFELNAGSATSFSLAVTDNDSVSPDIGETLQLASVGQLYKWAGTSWGAVSGQSLAQQGNAVIFTPESSALGLYKFSYTVNDGNASSASSTDAEIVITQSQDSSLAEWRFLKNFGYYSMKGNQWIYHYQLGWVYLSTPNGERTFDWMWSETLGWIWTGDSHSTKQLAYPYFYSNELMAWCNIEFLPNGLPDTLASGNWVVHKYGANNTSSITLSSSEYGTSIVKENLSKATDVNSAIQVIRDSSLFTSSEKDAIELQLLFTGRSSILSDAGITLSF